MTRKIAYFTDSVGFGGAEKALMHLLASLDRRRWHPVLFHHDAPGITAMVHGAHRLNIPTRIVPPLPLGTRGAVRLPPFAQRVRSERPDIFHAHLTGPLACKYGIIGAKLARVPAVVATQHLFFAFPYTLSARVQQRLVVAAVDRYIAVSDDVGEQLHRTFRVPRRKIQTIHNGIPAHPSPHRVEAALRASLTRGQERPLVLVAARLSHQKGIAGLLRAAARVPGAVFVVAGDGPERVRLEAQADDLGVRERTVFLGHREDIPDLLAVCDLFVLPSLFEGLPLSVLEAMQAGKPVVATAIGGTSEAVVPGETGFLVPPGDPVALADAILTVLSDAALAHRLGAAGKARVGRCFSLETMAKRTMEAYDALLDASGGAHGRR